MRCSWLSCVLLFFVLLHLPHFGVSNHAKTIQPTAPLHTQTQIQIHTETPADSHHRTSSSQDPPLASGFTLVDRQSHASSSSSPSSYPSPSLHGHMHSDPFPPLSPSPSRSFPPSGTPSKHEHDIDLALTNTLTIDPSNVSHAVSENLWGVFFEEINHAGDGGLHSELISNRNLGDFDYAPWDAIGSASLSVDTSYPLNLHNRRSLRIKFTGETGTHGAYNPGYWGISLRGGESYSFSFYAISHVNVSVMCQLMSSNGNTAYWSQQFDIVGTSILPADVTLKQDTVIALPWVKYTATATIPTGVKVDPSAQLWITAPHAVSGQLLWLTFVSLRPSVGWRGLPYIRADLAEHVAALKPTFVRFPGGTFILGDTIVDRLEWKDTIGPIETRPGHPGFWGYYSSDGLGLYEYLCFIEKIGAKPIWVVNSGNSANSQQIPTKHIAPWVEDALNSLEFAMGAVNTTWGAIRAQMGHPQPFNIYALAIGNENCGMAYYTSNYGVFYAAFQKLYPSIRLIANCDLTQDKNKQPVQLWDYHIYTTPDGFIQNTHEFDGYPRNGPHIFNSEYAVTHEKGANKGNLIAAVSEAAWMCGLERNSDIVELASYAPLFVNENDRSWSPDAIVFNSYQSYGTPSYWTQYMFSLAQQDVDITNQRQQIVLATWNLPSAETSMIQSSSIAPVLSTSRYANQCTHLLIIKLVCVAAVSTPVRIIIPTSNQYSLVSEYVEWRTMTSDDKEDENTFQQPMKIVPYDTQAVLNMGTDSSILFLILHAYSIHILHVQVNITQSQ